MSLIDICYEKIKDSFHYGLFGDFKLIIDKNTGYFNATKLCKDGGKEYKHWYENIKSKELVEYYNKKLSVGIPADSNNYKNSIYYVNLKGNNINNIITGTYVYKKLLLDIASWVSKDFYDKCYDIIEDYYVNDFKLKYEYNIKDLSDRINEIEINKNNIINVFNTRIKDKIINVPRDVEIYSNIVLIKLYYDDKYYMTTVRDKDLHKKIRKLRNIYSNLQILYRLSEVPNAKYLYDNIKNRLIEEEIAEFKYSTFNFKETTDDYRDLEILVTDILDEEYENIYSLVSE
ncbi:N1R/p28-like protein [Adoxophyes honmai entomopoxvirus 'L']|uniref:N1R/p28-like protein n=1 Tax=Adoxophyes honmai entomopoxvirus 'L' TaxID=1293540 RepID=A0A916KNT2_9POXV|nr:N1R/p28-like protein [Adoxophyes honmai entomopoxvirus 'L']YP_008004067.1 N1R/p28-like protein [Adoxophyes honmai entomopoxvirus 'L']CCU55325.1 N1R/p28-like protein [Adoxophyes honmai entomopoxvirus 'L']CCU55565.1 N1R/p28-like protein [Adoxophyes honmai entomopoxvirus 'L']